MTAPDLSSQEFSVTAWSTAELVEAARDGDAHAWDELVQRYAGLVMAICRKMRLSESDAADVSQTVWLRLVEGLPKLRNPAALPGWLATTTRHEALHVRQQPAAVTFLEEIELDAGAEPLDAELLAAERRTALRQAVAALPAEGRALLSLLMADPPVPYSEISRRLGIPVGSIGPTRRRLIDKLRDRPELAFLLHDADDDGAPAAPPSGLRRS